VRAESLAADLARTGSRYSLATVNRILREFADWDLLQVHDLGAGVVFYDTVTTPHPHIYNEDTGELLDLSPEQAWIRGSRSCPRACACRGCSWCSGSGSRPAPPGRSVSLPAPPGGQRSLSAASASAAQPTMKATPPTGVTAPSARTPVKAMA
jgi:hypothetical protein